MQQRGRLRRVVRQGHVLVGVVGQHLRCDLMGHFGEQRVATPDRQPARPHHPVEQDLDVDLTVRSVHTAGVVDGIRVEQPAIQCVLDPTQLRKSQVAALPHDLAAQVAAVDPDRVVGAVADLGMAFVGRLDECADTTVPQQVDRRAQDRLEQFLRSHDFHGVRDAERPAHLWAGRNRLGRTWVHAAAAGDELGRVVGPRGAGQLVQPAALRKRDCRVGIRVHKHVAVIERCEQSQVR